MFRSRKLAREAEMTEEFWQQYVKKREASGLNPMLVGVSFDNDAQSLALEALIYIKTPIQLSFRCFHRLEGRCVQRLSKRSTQTNFTPSAGRTITTGGTIGRRRS